MKRYVLFVLILSVFTFLKAQSPKQNKQTLEAGINSVFFSSGDKLGVGLTLEYQYAVNPFLSIAPRLMSAGSGSVTKSPYIKDNFSQTSAYGLSISGKLTPFPNHLDRLKIDLGGLYINMSHSWGNVDAQEPDYGYITSETVFLKDHLFGFIGSFSFQVINSEKITSGIRLDLLTSLDEWYLESEGMQGGIFFGMKF